MQALKLARKLARNLPEIFWSYFVIELTPRCSCDGMAKPMIIYNEMMVKNEEYEWGLDLRNAKTDRFKELNRNYFGLNFGFKNISRFYFDLVTCLNYPFLNF